MNSAIVVLHLAAQLNTVPVLLLVKMDPMCKMSHLLL